MEKFTFDFIDKINIFIAMFGAALTYAFGDHWPLFGILICLNILDVVTGTIARRKLGEISSAKAVSGLIKKIGCWSMIALGFLMSSFFIEVGEVLHVNLEGVIMFGWLVLIYQGLNEMRSIIENLVLGGYSPPRILTKGLEVANRIIDDVEDVVEDAMEEKSKNPQ